MDAKTNLPPISHLSELAKTVAQTGVEVVVISTFSSERGYFSYTFTDKKTGKKYTGGSVPYVGGTKLINSLVRFANHVNQERKNSC